MDAREEPGAHIHVTLPDGILGHWDAERLSQAIRNVVHNAIRFDDGRAIQVTGDGDRECATVEVRDQGVGIEPERQRRIFERFERASSLENYGGMGLGLFIARQILTDHDGRIELESEPGRGTVVRMELPRG